MLRLLAQSGVRLGPNACGRKGGCGVPEEAPSRRGCCSARLRRSETRVNMRAVVEGIETMRHEEAVFWAGMATHRRHSRRILMALRILLDDGGTRSTPAVTPPVS